MKRLFFILFLLFLSSYLIAQKDTFQLKEIGVKSVLRSNFNIGATTQNFDSITLSNYSNNNLADLLSSESGVFIKSYGLGSLATSSVRGAGASHTKVLWNGFDVSNPMLGQVDFSYLNVSQFEDITIQMGNTSGLYGGGTQGGVIHLNNKSDFNKRDEINLNLGFGSFGQFNQNLNYKSSKNNVSTLISLNNKYADNDFEYIEFNKIKKRENAQISSFGTNITNNIKVNKYSTFSINNWYQNNKRGIPTAIGIPDKGEQLNNEFFRNSVTYNYYGNNLDFKLSAAHFNESLNYNNSQSGLISNSRFAKSIGEVELKQRINNQNEILFGYNVTDDNVFSANYISNVSRLTNAFFIAYKSELIKRKIYLSQTVRKEFVKGVIVPLTGSSGIVYNMSEQIDFSGSISRNYRLPTFNDLFYTGLGNPELESEKGWGGEVSSKYTIKNSWIKLTGFYNDYSNWINWQPQKNGLWQPQNNDVLTKGIELTGKISYQNLYSSINYTYTESINVETDFQMIYIPKNTSNLTFGYLKKGFNISFQEQFIGGRYITTDNKNSMPYFLISNMDISKIFKIEESQIVTSFKVNNILNAKYQTILNQPMAGRFYELNFNIIFKNNNI